jgi:hypothetical protein
MKTYKHVYLGELGSIQPEECIVGFGVTLKPIPPSRCEVINAWSFTSIVVHTLIVNGLQVTLRSKLHGMKAYRLVNFILNINSRWR